MSSTYIVRIPRDLKEKMEENPEEEWSSEIRNFLEERVKQIELIKTIKQIETRLQRKLRGSWKENCKFWKKAG